MNKIDIKNWQKYKITDFFAPLSVSKKLTKIELEDDGEIPVYSSEILNNGVFGYTNKEPEFIISKQTPFYLIFGDHTKSMNIAESNFCVMDNVKVLKPKININILKTKYITTVWKSSIPNLGYARHWSVAEKIDILLPTTSKGKPDWEYMESYMKNIMQESEKNIEDLQNISELKGCIQTEKWSNFSCSELFNAKNTGNILARDIEDGSGETPYVTASGINNGVVAYIDASKYDIIEGHCILIGGKTFTVTYQSDDFVSNDSHNFVIRTNSYNISDFSYKYLVTVIRSYFGQKYSWNDAVTKDKFFSENIPLPANSNGEPDWEYMENYMKNIMQDTQSKLDKLVCC